MKDVRSQLRSMTLVVLVFVFAASAAAQTCYTTNDMDAATRSAIQGAAQQYMSMVQSGNYAGLKNASIPALAGSFDISLKRQRQQLRKWQQRRSSALRL